MVDELKQFKEHVASWDNTPRCVRCNREATHEIKPSSVQCDYQPHCPDCVEYELRTCQEVADHEMCHFGGAYGIPSLDVRAITRHEPQREKVDVEALKREALDHIINPDNLSGVTASDINMIFSGARRMFDYMHSRNLIRGAVPEGMVLVPRESNQAMYDAGERICNTAFGGGYTACPDAIYKAMIKAYEEGK